MSMFKGFSNAFKIPELRKKIFLTLGLVLVCRLVSQIPTPGVNWHLLQSTMEKAMSGDGGMMLDWFNVFTGGAMTECGIGFLSIWPYISAQIVIQLLSSVIPSLEKLKKEGESGRQRLAQITRYLTICICVAQAWGIATMLENPGSVFGIFRGVTLVDNPGLGFHLMTVLGMTTASLFVMWIADQITTFGIGNGGSMIIMINITSRLPHAIQSAVNDYFVNSQDMKHSAVAFAILLLFGFAVVMGTVMLTQGVRKVAIHATRRSMGGGNAYGMQQTFMPLRVNYTGVMPIIFAQPLLQVLAWAFRKIPDEGSFLGALHWFGEELTISDRHYSAVYLVIYALVILFFAFFWVASQFNAVDISENLKKEGSYVPGIRPGRATAEYLDAVMTRITLIGACGLITVALLPQILSDRNIMDVPWAIASFFGGTSLLIIVGVALDTLRVMESHLLVRKYDGFLRHGSLRGRGGM